MSDWSNKVLEKVARKLHHQTMKDYYHDGTDANDAVKMLQSELGPLLEAGQAMRERIIGSGSWDAHPANDQWDAAKAKLLGEDQNGQ